MMNDAVREHRLGNLAHAKTLYQAHLDDNPSDDEAWHAFGILLAQLNLIEEAKNAVEKAISLKKNQSTYYNSLGNIYRQQKKYDDAIKSYQKAIKINSNYPSAYNNLGNIYFQQKQFTVAKKAYEKAIDLKNNYADAYCNLGILSVELNDNTTAITQLQKALILQPGLLTALHQLGDCYLRDEKWIDAKNIFLQIIEQLPHHAEAHHRLGICFYHLTETEKALDLFQQTLLLNPNHFEAHQYLANIALNNQDYDTALQHYFSQLEKNPLYETYYNIAVLLMHKERFKEALIYFDEAEKINSADTAIALNRGHIYLKRGEFSKAIDAYKNVLREHPDNTEVKHIIAALTEKNPSKKAPEDFVTHLFDQYAPYYDRHLIDRLSYETPQKILQLIQQESPYFFEKPIHALDLGCGTGLCGVILRPHITQLTGIDLSNNMLAIAQTKNCYDSLIEDDIETGIAKITAADLVIAGDVFTYLGDLTAIFNQVSRLLSQEGLFIFTVEKSFNQDYTLQKTIRYAHSQTYIERLATQYCFDILRVDTIPLRKQKAEWIEGYLVALLKR